MAEDKEDPRVLDFNRKRDAGQLKKPIGGNTIAGFVPNTIAWANRKQDDFAYAPTKSYEEDGTYAPALGNWGTDAGRNNFNFLGTVIDMVTGKKQAVLGGGLGDRLFGSTPNGYSNPTVGGGKVTEEPASDPRMTFADFLKMARDQSPGYSDVLGNVTAIDYSPAIQDANNQATKNRAYLQAIYDQLDRELSDDVASSKQLYEGSAGTIAQNRDQTAGEVGEGYDAAMAQQSAILDRLGIGETQAQSIEEGRHISNDAAAANAAVQGQGQRALDYNTAVGNSEQQYGQRLQSAGQFARTDALGELESSLASMLNKYSMLQQEANQQAAAQNASIAAQNGANRQSYDQGLYSLARELFNGYNSAQSEQEAQLRQLPDYWLPSASQATTQLYQNPDFKSLPENIQKLLIEQVVKGYAG